MRLWSVLALSLLAGCLTPAVNPSKDGQLDSDTQVDTDTGANPGDTNKPGDTSDSGDTGAIDDTFNPGDSGDSGDSGQPSGAACHPFDPTDLSYGAWSRGYKISFANGTIVGKETHTPKGVMAIDASLATIAANNSMPTTGTAYEAKVTQAGGNNSTITHWRTCAGGVGVEQGFQEIGVSGRPKQDAIARSNVQYLPTESQILSSSQPSWKINAHYKVKYPGANNAQLCPQGKKTADRKVSGQFAASGFETITTPLTGAIDAWHVTAFLETEELTDGSVINPLCKNNINYSEKRKVEQWYVKGIGLVKEIVIDADLQSVTLWEKELTSCTGLPGCP